jgi:leucyl-tRNA synthetase/8-oxo-dGTP pyrophosphatase MutT (NUDIX family)
MSVEKSSEKYNPKEIEPKYIKLWEELGIYNWNAESLKTSSKQNPVSGKKYILDAFAYPSSSGLHAGHALGYAATDIVARFNRLSGYQVLYPIGWDSFGLPAENYAIKNGVHPKESTEEAIHAFQKQLKLIGLSTDWSKEIATHTPEYYQFTQWWFAFLYKQGLAYKKEALVNWDPIDQTVLANEQVLADGTAERSGAKVEQRLLSQWFFKITDYADRLLEDLDKLDWPESTKQMQKHWIGKSIGAEVDFKVADSSHKITVFTTRIDTIFSGTFLILAPEHPLISSLTTPAQFAEITEYQEKTKQKSDLQRTDLNKDKAGAFTGSFAINPANGFKMPIWISDFVLGNYGTGAVFADAHDERDFELAKKYGIPLNTSITSPLGNDEAVKSLFECYSGEGILYNSGQFDGLHSSQAKPAIIAFGEKEGWAKAKTTYRLRDWLVSRQRYWGSPIPIVYKPVPSESVLEELSFGTPLENAIYRNGSMAVVFNPKTGKYAYYKNLSDGKIGLAGGGADDGEDLAEVAARETAEELGLSDIKSVYPLGEKMNVHYYHSGKNLNRVATAYPFLIILNSEDGSSAREAHENFETLWGDADEIISQLEADSTSETTRLHYVEGMKRGVSLAIALGLDKTNSPEIFNLYSLKEELVDETKYPILLPEDVEFKPTGQSPLVDHLGFHASAELEYGVGTRRESDTLDTFVCSSWYFLRFTDPLNSEKFAATENMNNWAPVDTYVIGTEHTVLHLLYARFFTKVAFDAGLINFDEPFLNMRHPGLVLGDDSRKMSKRWGNGVNPTDVVEELGADTLRLYLMFMAPFDQPKPWNKDTIKGVKRFLDRVWKLENIVQPDSSLMEETDGWKEVEVNLNQLIEKVASDVPDFKFNTSVAKFMEFMNLVESKGIISVSQLQRFLIIFSPFCPFITEQMWQSLHNYTKFEVKNSVHSQTWPEIKPEYLVKNSVVVGVQVNGKVRGEIEINIDEGEAEVKAKVMENPAVQKWVEGKEITKFIYIPGKIVNVVV